ncbi:MAG: hypothetical protein JNL19_13595 [Burkholderiales bacterium]|nr:hypothetical protein [Burkholderiales bacterium]
MFVNVWRRAPMVAVWSLLSLFAATAPAQAATLCVTPASTPGCYTQIAAAVTAASNGDIITIAAGTYNESDIALTKSLSFLGAGTASTIVDGASTFAAGRSIFTFPDPSLTVYFSQMTLQRAYRAIDLSGPCANTVILERVRLTGNGPGSGAAIFTSCSNLNVLSSTLDNNTATTADHAGCDWGGGGIGGAIASLCGGSSTIIRNSTISNNRASWFGGAIAVNDGQLLIENSTVSGNSAQSTDSSNQVANWGGGGALWVSGAFPQVAVRFSTLANNAAPNGVGGVVAGGRGDPNFPSFVTFEANIFSGNSAGFTTAVLTSRSGPTVSTANCGHGADNGVESRGYNVLTDASCPFAATGDISNAMAQLGALGNNGGLTSTHLPGPSSAALNRAAGCGASTAAPNLVALMSQSQVATTDQRGIARPQGGVCDAGAVELRAGVEDVLPPVPTLAQWGILLLALSLAVVAMRNRWLRRFD